MTSQKLTSPLEEIIDKFSITKTFAYTSWFAPRY